MCISKPLGILIGGNCERVRVASDYRSGSLGGDGNKCWVDCGVGLICDATRRKNASIGVNELIFNSYTFNTKKKTLFRFVHALDAIPCLSLACFKLVLNASIALISVGHSPRYSTYHESLLIICKFKAYYRNSRLYIVMASIALT